MTIEIVFFDAGETLIHPHPSFPELFAQICSERGVEVRAERVAEVQGRLAPHLVDLAEETGVENPSLNPEDSRLFWTFLYRRLLDELGIENAGLVDALYARFSDLSTYRLFDDALPTLRELSDRGYRMGLISNFEEWLDEMLIELQVGHLLEPKVISGLEGVEKPDPAIYELALARAGTTPARSVHVGDSPGLDIEPSSKVGMVPILVDRWDQYPSLDVTRVSSLKEIPDLVANL